MAGIVLFLELLGERARDNHPPSPLIEERPLNSAHEVPGDVGGDCPLPTTMDFESGGVNAQVGVLPLRKRLQIDIGGHPRTGSISRHMVHPGRRSIKDEGRSLLLSTHTIN